MVATVGTHQLLSDPHGTLWGIQNGQVARNSVADPATEGTVLVALAPAGTVRMDASGQWHLLRADGWKPIDGCGLHAEPEEHEEHEEDETAHGA